MPSSDQDIVQYSHTFDLSCLRWDRQAWVDEMARYDCVKRVTQLNLEESQCHSLEDLEQYRDITPPSVRDTSRRKEPKYPLKYKGPFYEDFFIESKEFELISDAKTLVYCQPSVCKNLILKYPDVKESASIIKALKGLKMNYFCLEMHYEKSTHLFLLKLLESGVTDLILSIVKEDLSKIPLKGKDQIKTLLLSSESIKTLSIREESTTECFKKVSKMFSKEQKLNLKKSVMFTEVFV
ncbi:unnamed protein product [Moneuplotes crassus]|uniref:Uncharacterized protein n=1 Tax=Euplotes crassus TaxID=5936 RepID=A0AAD1TYN6_EUPCR|nr:unnamed protein product [Moneuplotes crassus]